MPTPTLYYTLLDTAARAGNKAGVAWLKRPVFDISDITAAFPADKDVKDHLKTPVPRRPPFDQLWVECERVEQDSHPAFGSFEHVWQEGWAIWRDDQYSKIVQWDEGEVASCWGYLTYLMLKKTTLRNTFGNLVGRLFSVPQLGILAMTPDWTKAGATRVPNKEQVLDPLGVHCVPFPVVNQDAGVFTAPWYPLMAFGLLNCVNVSAESETAPARANEERARRHGLPERPDYKTLRIHVPKQVEPQRTETGHAGKHLRQHVCRGHFKMLKAARWLHPGWHWWNACLRGDPELGTIEKDYGVEVDRPDGGPTPDVER